MIFLESINFSLIKINTIIFVLFSKIQPKVWNLFRTNLINFVKFSTIWSSYNVSDLPKPLKIYCILCTSMGYVLFLWIKFIFLNLYLKKTSTGNRYIRIGMSVNQCKVDLSAVTMLHFNGQLIFKLHFARWFTIFSRLVIGRHIFYI